MTNISGDNLEQLSSIHVSKHLFCTVL